MIWACRTLELGCVSVQTTIATIRLTIRTRLSIALTDSRIGDPDLFFAGSRSLAQAGPRLSRSRATVWTRILARARGGFNDPPPPPVPTALCYDGRRPPPRNYRAR